MLLPSLKSTNMNINKVQIFVDVHKKDFDTNFIIQVRILRGGVLLTLALNVRNISRL